MVAVVDVGDDEDDDIAVVDYAVFVPRANLEVPATEFFPTPNTPRSPRAREPPPGACRRYYSKTPDTTVAGILRGIGGGVSRDSIGRI